MDLPFTKGTQLPYLVIFRPGPACKLPLVLLSSRLVAYPTHWASGRDQLCRAELQQACRYCAHGMKPNLGVYGLAMETRTRKLGIAHITGGAWRYCDELQRHAADCRGLHITLARGAGRNSGVYVLVHPQRWALDRLPPLADCLEACLFRLWSVNRSGPGEAAVGESAADPFNCEAPPDGEALDQAEQKNGRASPGASEDERQQKTFDSLLERFKRGGSNNAN